MSGQDNGDMPMFPDTAITLTDPMGRVSPVTKEQKSSFPKPGPKRPKIKTAKTLSDKLKKLTSPNSKRQLKVAATTKRINVALDQNWVSFFTPMMSINEYASLETRRCNLSYDGITCHMMV